MMLTAQRAILDFHSHILPEIDDGSKSVAESAQLLGMLRDQGVTTVIATPHYNANRERVDRFLERRQLSRERMREVVSDDMPDVLLGAEVVYYQGIDRMEGLERLCIEGTRLLLLEMPQRKWSNYTVDELINLTSLRRIIPVVAHVERCLPYQSKDILNTLCQSGVLVQINASYIINLRTRRKALRALSRGLVHVIGSDCHSVRTRPPRLERAYEIVSARLGEDFVAELIGFNRSLVVK